MLRNCKIASLAMLWLVPLLIFSAAFSSEWLGVWRTFGVPSMLPRFADLSTIPEGLETMRHGQDPLVTNPTDALRRPVNYPRIWLQVFSALKINVRNVWIVALVFCALYLLCVSVLIARARHAADALILLLAGLSVSPLLAMERGNNDLFVFALLFLGCVAANGQVKSLSLSAAALLKIFPVAGLVIHTLRRPLKQRMAPILLTVLVFALFAWQWHDLNLIRFGTPISRIRSYGFLSLQQEVLHFFPESLIYFVQLGWIVAGAFFFSVILTVDLAWKGAGSLDADLLNSPEAEMFAVFGGTYAFTYAIGSNWDYRLILLLPTLPFVLDLARTARFRRWAVAYLILVGVAENALALERHGGTLLVHLASFVLFLFVLAALARQFKSVLSAECAGASAVVPAS